jgi:hypothetical protein|nr:hypothetical protein [Neorhizobium tomejilense]
MALDILGLNCPDRQLHRKRRYTVRESNTLAERLVPIHFNAWREQKHAFDAVISGHNPLLAAILLRQAVSYGLKCLVTFEGGDDGWPYDLATHPHAVLLAASSMGLKSDRYGSPARFFAGLTEEFIATEAGMVTVLEKGLTLRALVRQHDGEVSLDAERCAPSAPSSDRDILSGNLALALAASPKLTLAPKGKLFVFSKRAILTGLSDGFAPGSSDGSTLAYDNRYVHAVGTAARATATDVEKAEMMVDDIVRCARFEF